MINIKKHKFSSGAMSIIQMGEEQIGHPTTAINELVKNAYDADADRCWVYTQYDKDPQRNFFLVKDNGLGMNAETLFGNWLVTSRSSKRSEELNERRSQIYERRFLGSKGIGRLAAMALGRYLTVITKQSNDSEYNWLRIDRESFRVEGLLDEVSFSGGQIQDFTMLFSDLELLRENNLVRNGNLINLISSGPLNDFREGTMIVLQDVDDSIQTIIENEINYKDLEQTAVYKGLVDLITPLRLNNEIQDELVKEGIIQEAVRVSNGIDTFELFYGANFIKNSIKGISEFLEVQTSKIIEHYDYRILGKVAADSRVMGKYICKRLDTDQFSEDFNVEPEFLLSSESLKVRKTVESDDIPEKYRDAKVGEFYFDIRVYDLDDDSKVKMAKLLGVRTMREATETMARYIGLKISKNGFGVKPYGEEQKDWLGLGAQRVNKHLVSIGPNQLLGYTFLYSPENDGLSEKTNREGFFENKAFITFKKCVSGILEEAGRRRAKYRLRHNLGRGRLENKLSRPDSEKFIQYLASKTEDSQLIEYSKRFIHETNTALDNMQESLTLSQRLATLGTGLELVYHELSQPLTAMGSSLDSLQNNINRINDELLRTRLIDRATNIERSLTLIEDLRDSLQPAIGKSIAKEFLPLETFKKVLHLFKDKIEHDAILINIATSLTEAKLKAVEYPFWISFLNIINNAMYWLNQTDQKKIINFQFEAPAKYIISNTGPKINEDELELIFEYGFTGKKERNATGLGLAFTASMLSSIGWTIHAENFSFGPAFILQKSN